ncbi:MAG TPA: lysylphosphatidylglycerol synthase transmembrane domain-containing protein [Candidatus Omnitrophota bacterium]|nr:lysylphosphatidylglycerol synthase transmembrane domain-containing protein [Candidatus Omnitrophota bacterium]
MGRFLTVIQVLLFAAGLALFGHVLLRSNPQALLEILLEHKAGILFILVVYPFFFLWGVLAWRTVFGEEPRSQTTLIELFFIRLAGESVNFITPILDVGGEPLKVLLAHKRFEISRGAGLSSVVMDRSAQFLAQLGYMGIGLLLTPFLIPLPAEWHWILWIVLSIMGIVTALVIFLQKRGFFTLVIEWIESLGIHPKFLHKLKIPLKKVDEDIAAFYTLRRSQIRGALVFHSLAWISLSVETYLICRVLDIPISFAQAFALEALVQLVRTASFFIPANLGVQESSMAYLFSTLGYSPTQGLAVSLSRRLRQIVWNGIGYGVWGVYQLLGIREESDNGNGNSHKESS